METFFLYLGILAQMVMLGAIALGFVFAVYKK